MLLSQSEWFLQNLLVTCWTNYACGKLVGCLTYHKWITICLWKQLTTPWNAICCGILLSASYIHSLLSPLSFPCPLCHTMYCKLLMMENFCGCKIKSNSLESIHGWLLDLCRRAAFKHAHACTHVNSNWCHGLAKCRYDRGGIWNECSAAYFAMVAFWYGVALLPACARYKFTEPPWWLHYQTASLANQMYWGKAYHKYISRMP